MAETAIRPLAGNLATGIETYKHGQVSSLSDDKEMQITKIEKLHTFMKAFKEHCLDKEHPAVNMDEEPFCHLVDEMRELFGEEVFPQGVYCWQGKAEVDGFRQTLIHEIERATTAIKNIDARITLILEELKQMLDFLRDLGKDEQHSLERIIGNSRGG